MQALFQLHVSFNGLSGSIGCLDALPDSAEFSLGGNKFSGTIPDGVLRKTNHVDFHDNKLSGTLGTVILVQELNIMNNDLIGTLPCFNHEDGITLISGRGNWLEGSLPQNLYAAELVFLDMTGRAGRRGLEVPLPSGLSRASDLDTLLLAHNLLDGRSPPLTSTLLMFCLHNNDVSILSDLPGVRPESMVWCTTIAYHATHPGALTMFL